MRAHDPFAFLQRLLELEETGIQDRSRFVQISGTKILVA